MNWNAFWSAMLGTTIPAFVASLIMLYMTHRTNKALELHRNVLAERLSIIESELRKRAEMFSVWHQKRVNALVEIYEAFMLYLDFLRRALYIPDTRTNLDPMWDFRTTVERNLVFLDDDLQSQVQEFSGELLQFWNWAHQQKRTPGPLGEDPVQKRLDYEIPTYLEKLRQVINRYADPGYARSEGSIKA
jgi:hypothetical protein